MRIRTLLLPAAAIASASWAGLTATSCCNQHLCDGMRVLGSQIAKKYESCCQQGVTPECMQDISDKSDATQGLLLAAKIACDNGDDALARDTVKSIRDLWLPKIIKELPPGFAPGQAVVWNTWPVFRNSDWVDLDVTLPMTADGCSTQTVVIVGDQIVMPEATGGAAEEEASLLPGGEIGEPTVAVVIPSGSPSAALVCTYRVPSESQFSVRFADPRESMDLSGTIKIAQYIAPGNAITYIPADVDLAASYLGIAFTLKLDKTCPYNTLTVGAAGHGTLGVALKMESPSHSLASSIYQGGTFYFTLPVELAANAASLRIHCLRAAPGSQYTPCDPMLLVAADGPHPLVPPQTPGSICDDTDGNGIRDGADAVIKAMNVPMAPICDPQ